CRRPGSRMKNDIHDLGLVLDSRVRLIVIESWEELRVLEAIATLAVKRSQTWYTWNQVEGLQRLGFGTALDASEDMSDPEHALDYIRRQNEPATFVFCDLHPFMQSPRVVRLVKMIAMNAQELAPTLWPLCQVQPLDAELRSPAARCSLSKPSDE